MRKDRDFFLKGAESKYIVEKNKMDPEKNVVASLALHAVLEPVFKEVSRYTTWHSDDLSIWLL